MSASARTSRYRKEIVMRTSAAPSRSSLRATLVVLAGLPFLAACAARRGSLDLPAGHPAAADVPGIAVLAAPVASPAPRAEPVAGAVETPAKYVCPMHADVVSDAPGKCPKCGMALRLVKEKAAPVDHGDHK